MDEFVLTDFMIKFMSQIMRFIKILIAGRALRKLGNGVV